MSSVESEAQAILDSLPPRFRVEAESVRAMGERERWISGDQAVELVDELVPRYTRAAVRLALALLYHVTDSTIRDREYVCRRIPAEMRAAYPALSYHYWRACAQSGKPLDLAAQVTAYLEAWGRLPSVNSVYGWLHDGGSALPVWVLRMGGVLTAIEKIKSDPLLPGEAGAAVEQAGALLLGVLSSHDALGKAVEDANKAAQAARLAVDCPVDSGRVRVDVLPVTEAVNK